MTLFETIQKDMYQAMKSGRKQKATVLRGVLAKLNDKRIEKRDELSETEEIKVLQSLVKQRRESIDLYRKGGRTDLVEQESAELEILEQYLPKMMSEEEIRNLVKTVVEETGASSLSDIGKVMPQVMKRGAGRIDGKVAQRIVREFLQ
ncbi:MAG: GatB/YqeY domain-containing protein [FCB group bacterium]|nr:GatB/YqeY domain-containing protein [FCB group bacterium]